MTHTMQSMCLTRTRRLFAVAACTAMVIAGSVGLAPGAIAANWSVNSQMTCAHAAQNVHVVSWTTGNQQVIHRWEALGHQTFGPRPGQVTNVSNTGSRSNFHASVATSGTFTQGQLPQRQCHGV